MKGTHKQKDFLHHVEVRLSHPGVATVENDRGRPSVLSSECIAGDTHRHVHRRIQHAHIISSSLYILALEGSPDIW